MFYAVRNIGNTLAMSVTFFFFSTLDLDFKNAEKNSENVFFLR